MNAISLDDRKSLKTSIDDVIATHGLKSVLLAVLARLVLHSRSSGSSQARRTSKHGDVLLMNDHLRRDIGLKPDHKPVAYYDLTAWSRRDPL